MVYLPDDLDTDAPPKDFELIPAGTTATAECIAAEEKVTATGKTQIALMWRLEDAPYKNRRVWDHLCFSDGRKTRSRDVCKALGLALKPGAALLCSSFVGLRATVTISVDEYQGKQKNKIAWDGYAPIVPDGTPVAADGEEDDIPF